MRKKPPAQNEVSVTPIRRSTRLQQEKTSEKNEPLPERSRSRPDDILQPRESIKAYRKQVDPTKERPDQPETPSAPGGQLDIGRPAEKEKVLLDTPNIQWEVVKDRQSRLQVLDTSKPQSGKVGHPEDTTTPSLRRPVETRREPRQETWTEITPRIKVPPMKKMETTTKLPRKFSPAKEDGRKWFKFSRFSWSSLCFLLFFLLLILTCWLVWNHGVSTSLVLGNISLMWKKLTMLWNEVEECSAQCSLVLLESIPDTLQYPPPNPQNPTTYEGWMNLLSEANSVVEIGAFYFTLRDSDLQMEDASAKPVSLWLGTTQR